MTSQHSPGDLICKPASLDDVRHLGTLPVYHPTKPDAADVLGCSRNTAYGMARRGELPTLRLGSRVVVPVPALLAMLGERLVTPQNPPA